MTPAQKAGINQKAEWKELLIKAVNHLKVTTLFTTYRLINIIGEEYLYTGVL